MHTVLEIHRYVTKQTPYSSRQVLSVGNNKQAGLNPLFLPITFSKKFLGTKSTPLGQMSRK